MKEHGSKTRGYEVNEDLHRRFKSQVTLRGTSVKQAVSEALTAWLDGAAASEHPSYDRATRDMHDLLDFVLQHGTEEDRDLTHGHLKNFAQAIQRRSEAKIRPIRKRAK